MSLEDFKNSFIFKDPDKKEIPNFKKYIIDKYKKDTQLWESGLKEIVEYDAFYNIEKVYYYARDLSKHGIKEEDWRIIPYLGFTCFYDGKKVDFFNETIKLIPSQLIESVDNKDLALVYIMRQTVLDDRLMQPLVEWVKTIDSSSDDFKWYKLKNDIHNLIVENGYLDIVREIINEMLEYKVVFNR